MVNGELYIDEIFGDPDVVKVVHPRLEDGYGFIHGFTHGNPQGCHVPPGRNTSEDPPP